MQLPDNFTADNAAAACSNLSMYNKKILIILFVRLKIAENAFTVACVCVSMCVYRPLSY